MDLRLHFILFLLAAALAAPATAQEAPVRVMSFNIRYNNPNDGIHAWPERADRAASVIRFHRADLVGVQEALKGQLDDLAARLPGYARLGVGRDDGKEAGEFSAILYREDRFEVLASSTFWLSETPEVPGSKSWDAAITRVVTWARLRDRRTGGEFFHFNTHFDHRGQQSRTESARLLVERIGQIAGEAPVVVTGDFNMQEDAEGYAVLTQVLRDARKVTEEPAHGPAGTYYGGFVVNTEPGRRIDYVFVHGNVHVRSFGTLTDNWQGAFASDHVPVLAEVLIR